MCRYWLQSFCLESLLALKSLLIFIAVLDGLHAFSQVDSAEVTQNAASSQTHTLKVDVRRVNVDVVVTDAKNRPVLGLTQQDFGVEEDKSPQPLRSFTAHVEEEEAHAAPRVPLLPLHTFLNVPESANSGPPTVLLYDVLNTSTQERAYGEQEFLEFLKQHRPNGPIAIFGLSDKLYLLQGFNEERSLPDLQRDFERLIEAMRRNPTGSLDRSVAATLNGITEIGRFLQSLPGRKNLIWYSSSFPEGILPGPRMVNPLVSASASFSRNYWESIRRATDLLALSRVVVYPVDVRGVIADTTYNAARPVPYASDPVAVMSIRLIRNDMDNAKHATMDTLANDTGGHAFYGTNDLQEAVNQALLAGSTYYSLTYEPTNPKYDGSLRHIKVTLKKPGYNLAYRRTYYADDLAAVAHAAADAPENALTPALERGTPLAHGLFVEAHLEVQGIPVAATPAQMQVLSQYEAMRNRDQKPFAKTMPVMMQQYVISYGLIARQLDLPADESGTRTAALEFGVISYDEDGRKLNGLDSHIEETISPARYEKLAAEGYRAVQTIAIPVAAASLRLAVRDIQSNRTGSLEVRLPLAKPEGMPDGPRRDQGAGLP